jgi:RNA polymerase sporulation-specific sigma factor
MFLRRNKCKKQTVWLYTPIGTDKEGNEISLLDVIESQEPTAFEMVTAKDDAKKVYELIPSMLTEREREIIVLRYGLYGGNAYTQREVAQKLGISRSYISRIEKTAIEKLRSCF